MRDDETNVRLVEQRMMAAKQAQEQLYKQSHASPVNEAMQASSGRMSARGVLEQRYEALLREANGIHELLQALPIKMGREAEEALWKIAVDQR
jgi:hypothetical protein